MRRALIPLLVSCAGVAHAAETGAPKERAVVAVFPILDSSGRLEPSALSQLTDYLGVKVAETGGFVVVPRKDIEAALRGQKSTSYDACYDQACQVEIGKELAAQKILHTQIVQVGDSCAVTATLYDLRLAATDGATSNKGGCSENELVTSLEAVAAGLAPGLSSGVTAQPPLSLSKGVAGVAAPAAGPSFGLKLSSEPPGADVLLDGKFVGRTPARLSVAVGAPHRLTVQADGYELHSETLTLDADAQRSVRLRLTREARTTRNEWFGLSAAAGATLGGSTGGSVWLRLANLHFGRFAWAVVEASGGFYRAEYFDVDRCPRDELLDRGFCASTETQFAGYLGTRPAWIFGLGDGREHNLEVSLGFGIYAFTGGNDEINAFSLSPSVRYLHLGDGSFVYGGGLRALIPLSRPDCELGVTSVEDLVRCENANPIMVQLEVPFGWYK